MSEAEAPPGLPPKEEPVPPPPPHDPTGAAAAAVAAANNVGVSVNVVDVDVSMEAPPSSEVLAAAAAAAVANVGAGVDPQPAPQQPQQAPPPAGGAAGPVVPVQPPVPQQPQATGRLSLLNEEDAQGKRRFFPRVKHLIGNKEWEEFLTQVLQCIEEAGAPDAAAASHKSNNPWYRAFDLIYGGVAREYSIPTGKNRYHKFKDKILEVWTALEQQEPGANHCRDLALEQYERYKVACSEASKTGTGGSQGGGTGPPGSKAAKLGALASPHGAYALGSGSTRLAGGKRSYSAAMGGGASLSASSSGSAAGLWKNLDEATLLAGLPDRLRSLVHLKQLAKEMVVGTGNRPMRKAIEEHGKNLDDAYLAELVRYLGAPAPAASAPVAGATEDVEMGTGADPKEEDAGARAPASSYQSALEAAFLYRYASTLQEQKLLADAYHKHTCAWCLDPSGGASSAAEDLPRAAAPSSAPTAEAHVPPVVEAPVPDGGEAAAAVAAAAAVDVAVVAAVEDQGAFATEV